MMIVRRMMCWIVSVSNKRLFRMEYGLVVFFRRKVGGFKYRHYKLNCAGNNVNSSCPLSAECK